MAFPTTKEVQETINNPTYMISWPSAESTRNWLNCLEKINNELIEKGLEGTLNAKHYFRDGIFQGVKNLDLPKLVWQQTDGCIPFKGDVLEKIVIRGSFEKVQIFTGYFCPNEPGSELLYETSNNVIEFEFLYARPSNLCINICPGKENVQRLPILIETHWRFLPRNFLVYLEGNEFVFDKEARIQYSDALAKRNKQKNPYYDKL